MLQDLPSKRISHQPLYVTGSPINLFMLQDLYITGFPINLFMLQDLPSTGVEKYFQLHGRSSKSNVQGEIKLRLQLATREDRGLDEDDNWTDVRQHEDLICLFIEHEVRRLRVRSVVWGFFG